MSQYYIHLEDENGTGYGHCYPFSNDEIIHEDLDEARMDAKNQLRGDIVLAKIVECRTGRVVDFFEVK